MSRFRVTIEVMVDARSIDDALKKMQKLADVLNAKDHRNKAWIPRMVKTKEEKK